MQGVIPTSKADFAWQIIIGNPNFFYQNLNPQTTKNMSTELTSYDAKLMIIVGVTFFSKLGQTCNKYTIHLKI